VELLFLLNNFVKEQINKELLPNIKSKCDKRINCTSVYFIMVQIAKQTNKLNTITAEEVFYNLLKKFRSN